MQQNSFTSIQVGGLIVSIFSFLIATLALYVSRKSWLQANRPILTARISSAEKGGNLGTALNIIVENTGNRPAKNIKLSVSADALDSLFADNEVANSQWRQKITKIFSDRGVIPVLGNGKSISNSFGFLSNSDRTTWKDEARTEITISYEDFDGREFKHTNPLFIAGDEGFAGGSWQKAE